MTEILQPLSFPLLAALGALAGLLVQQYCARRNGVSRETGEWFAVFGLPLGVFCGHLLYAACQFNIQEGDLSVAWLFTPWRGGFMFWGVFAGCACASILACLIRRERFLPALDTVAAGLVVLVLFVRLAAPLDIFDGVSQGYGRTMEEIVAVFGFEPAEGVRMTPLFFPPELEFAEDLNLSVWLLESVWAAVILAMVLPDFGKRPAGKTAAMALVLYAAGQVLFEFLREDRHPKWLFVRVSQLFAGIVLAGLLIYATVRRLRLRQAILSWIGMAAAAGMVVLMAFMIEKPLIVGGNPIFFPHWTVYTGIILAAAAMGLIVWFGLYPRRPRVSKAERRDAGQSAPVRAVPLRGGKGKDSQTALRA
ncbi:MAG: prolipoprotein diacylglyceryl transferase, partial [Clostridia bacterium]|nr:prolipoprotein diacylglyceryl transferase [Clostridia bacterium]